MNRLRDSFLLFPIVLVAAAATAFSQPPAAPPAQTEKNEKIEAAFRLYLASAAEYEFKAGKDENPKALELTREPVLKWSNPAVKDVQGVIFLWCRDGRPMVVGGFYGWFEPNIRLEHEFHSLAEEPIAATFHKKPVWKTEAAGLKFEEIPDAPAPAHAEAQRTIQLKLLAKEFTGIAKYRNESADTELRLLPKPIHRYSAPNQNVLAGGLFAFVRSTDPEIFLAIEAQGKDAASARWRYAMARMTNQADLRLQHRSKTVWEAGMLPWKDLFGRHELPYTAFQFNAVPSFLTEAADKLKP